VDNVYSDAIVEVKIDKMLLEALLLMERRMHKIAVKDCPICTRIGLSMQRSYGCIKLQQDGCNTYIT
jgi:aminoglycoside phosphotransferase